MGDETGIEERIAAVVRAHPMVYQGSSACRCGAISAGVIDPDVHATHVAAAVVSGLREVGYTITWSTRWETGE